MSKNNAAVISWKDYPAYTRDDFIADFAAHRRLIASIAHRYFANPDDVDDGISEFFAAMLDDNARRWKQYTPDRGEVQNWLGWQARSFFGRQARARSRYRQRLINFAAQYPRTQGRHDGQASMVIRDQMGYAMRRLGDSEREAFNCCARAYGDRSIACHAIGISSGAMNQRLRGVRRTLARCGVTEIA